MHRKNNNKCWILFSSQGENYYYYYVKMLLGLPHSRKLNIKLNWVDNSSLNGSQLALRLSDHRYGGGGGGGGGIQQLLFVDAKNGILIWEKILHYEYIKTKCQEKCVQVRAVMEDIKRYDLWSSPDIIKSGRCLENIKIYFRNIV
jgi:hypothetical protein